MRTAEFMSRTVKLGARRTHGCAVLRSRKRQTGTMVYESLLSILIFMTLIFGAMGFSHMLYAYHFVNHIAKEATHWAAVNGHSCDRTDGDGSCIRQASAGDVRNYVKNHAPLGLDQTKIVTSACGVVGGVPDPCPDSTPAVCARTPNYAGCTVRVQVGYAFNFIFPLLPTSTTVTAPCTQAGFCLSSTSEMIISH